MKPDHTKGDWGISGDFGTGLTIASNNKLIAYIFDRSHPLAAPPKEEIANARLISASPDLLEALEMLMCSEGGEPRADDPESEAVWQKCWDALDKARGNKSRQLRNWEGDPNE